MSGENVIRLVERPPNQPHGRRRPVFRGRGRVTVEYTKLKWKLKWKPSVAGNILITGRHIISSLSFDRRAGLGLTR